MAKILIVLICFLWSTAGFAQVVTPSIDPALPSELSSAVAWRFGSAFGIKTVSGKEITATDNTGYYSNNSAALFAYQPGNIVMEIYGASVTEQHNWDPSTDILAKTLGSHGRLNLSIRGEKRVSVGIAFETGLNKNTANSMNTTAYEGSFSLRFMENFYLAAGLQRMTENHSAAGIRKWNRILSGIAFQAGDPFSSMFRVEVSYKTSPELEFQDQPTVEYRPAMADSKVVAELLFRGFLFSYRFQKVILSAGDESSQERNIDTSRYGVGYKFGSFLLGWYRFAGVDKMGKKRMETEKYQATISFGFI